MRLLILSDLHHELWGDRAPVIDPSISRPDLVILAGDIDVGAKAVAWAAHNFAGLPVLYVHGNHEAYGRELEQMQAELRLACANTANVIFLDCGAHLVAGVRFLGCTLWTDFRLFGDDQRQASMHAAETSMNDYRRIRLSSKGYRKLRAADTAQFHAQQKSWLTQQLEQPFDGRTVVITHMAPSMLSVDEKYRTDPTSPAYASRLDGLAAGADLWIHGHMHDPADYMLGQCWVVSNPCGYMTRTGGTENARFDPNFIVDLPTARAAEKNASQNERG